MLPERKAYESNLEAQLAKWKAELAVMRVQAKDLEGGTKLQSDQVFEAIQHKHDQATHRLNYLKEVRDDAWESVKVHTESTWAEIKALSRGRPGQA